MGTQSEQLKQEIEQTRHDISRDVDALAYKASPSRIVGTRVEKAKSGMVGLKEKVMGSTSHVSDATHAVASGVGSASSSVASSVASNVAGAASTAGHKTEDVASTVRRSAEGNPLAAGLVVFGLGWLVSSLIPASSAETRAASKLGDVASDKGAPVIERAKSELKTVASEMGANLKASATDAAQSVAATAKGGVATVREEGMSAAQDVAATAKGADDSDPAAPVDVTSARTEPEVGVAAGYGYSDVPASPASGEATNRI